MRDFINPSRVCERFHKPFLGLREISYTLKRVYETQIPFHKPFEG
jgi:hypothetical protein